jgi:hypothetical protein
MEITRPDMECTASAAERVVASRRQAIPFKASADSMPEVFTGAIWVDEGKNNALLNR